MNNINIHKIMLITVVCLLSATCISCKKDDNKSIKADAVVLDMGNPGADGCGWVLRINHVDYAPENLNDSFKQDSLPVKVNYNLLKTRYQCGLAANIGFNYIHINSIKKK